MIVQKVFHIGIKALIVNDNKALVLKQIKEKREIYDLPGGRIDVKEEIEDAIKRELKEELGVEDFRLGELVFAQERKDYKEDDGINLMLLFYKVEANISKITLSSEHKDFEWITKKDLEDIVNIKKNINSEIIMALEKVLK